MYNKLDLDNPLHVALKELIDDGLVVMYQNDDTGNTLLALTDQGEQFVDRSFGEYDGMFSDDDVNEKDLEAMKKDLTLLF